MNDAGSRPSPAPLTRRPELLGAWARLRSTGLRRARRPRPPCDRRASEPGPATLGELAEPFAITLQAVSKHISVLEAAGLVWRTREAQRRPVHLDAAALERLTAWIDRYRLVAESAYRRLDALLAEASTADRHRAAYRTGPPHPQIEGEEIMSNPVVIDAAPGQSYADITREFDAPVAAVFHAHGDPELFRAGSAPPTERRASPTGTSAAAAATATSRTIPTATPTRSAASSTPCARTT